MTRIDPGYRGFDVDPASRPTPAAPRRARLRKDNDHDDRGPHLARLKLEPLRKAAEKWPLDDPSRDFLITSKDYAFNSK
jgi:hypothetical protein